MKRVRYRLAVCKCDRAFAQVIRPGRPKRLCDPCSRAAQLRLLQRAQRMDERAERAAEGA